MGFGTQIAAMSSCVSPARRPAIADELPRAAKFWIAPVRLASSSGFSRIEIFRIEKVVGDNVDVLLSRWNRFFEDDNS